MHHHHPHCHLAQFRDLLMHKGRETCGAMMGSKTRVFLWSQSESSGCGACASNHGAVFALLHRQITRRFARCQCECRWLTPSHSGFYHECVTTMGGVTHCSFPLSFGKIPRLNDHGEARPCDWPEISHSCMCPV